VKLRTKLLIGLLGGVLAVYFVSAIVQEWLSAGSIGRFSRQSQLGEEARQWEWVERLQQATDASLLDAMSGGEMDKFNQLLLAQRKVAGLQELALFDADGRGKYSSDPDHRSTQLPAELKDDLLASPTGARRLTAGSFEVYQPIAAQKSCIECHVNWKPNQIAGVMSMRFSTEAYRAGQQTWLDFERNTHRASMMISGITAVTLAVAISFMVALAVHYLMTIPLRRDASALSQHADEVALAASAVATASDSVAQDSSEQAASVEEISASLEEISSVTRQNAAYAGEANQLAHKAHAAAEQGVVDIREMSVAMQTIKDSGADITKVIQTIHDIAFQTNILALNAAVEAARAGDAGMGFAVVAEEVRNLAQRSGQAARESAARIEEAISKTGRGVELSGKVVRALEDIVAKVNQVNKLVSQVASASHEQTQGVAQINTAVSQMDKITQGNAAAAEESASAAAELTAQAESMKVSVGSLLQLVDAAREVAPGSPGGNSQGFADASHFSRKPRKNSTSRELMSVD